MTARRAVDAALNAGTGLAIVAALALLTRDRVLPAWRERAVVGEGERVPSDLVLTRMDGPGGSRPVASGPAVLLVFQSTCPACDRALPAWTALLERLPAGVTPVAVALEPQAEGLRYARERLPGVVPTRPADERRFASRLGLRIVPSTLLVDSAGRLRFRHAGVPGQATADSILRLVAPAAEPSDAAHARGSP